jgi:hypothetical protein
MFYVVGEETTRRNQHREGPAGLAGDKRTQRFGVAPGIRTDDEVHGVPYARLRYDGTDPVDAMEIRDAFRDPPNLERRGDNSAQAQQVCRQERYLVFIENEVRTLGRRIAADGLISAVDLDHDARALISPALCARVGWRNPAVAKHPGLLKKLDDVSVEQVVKVAARPPERGGYLKPRPPVRQRRHR